ncbi:hypothetical protein COU78_03205 [Candidatus Peregrinibacteria bacterium CG10_big_fil_rev_8_21_14_0_10_49_24]|nr:MAG: hypothetical protein COV83_05025 [Candidatus Peregrinibacteria bacterium CG11_big_fil_rev_8_21_14_0_20_49_14]PIR51133.1 MAG: hypothetical protein COU78_03205 [Candidatus Peregrinibacteria bacterium CG10_big_fil_rev_8_21_14_0_10_49_24]
MSPSRSRRRAAVRSRRRSHISDSRSTVAFLLIACFGILFAGCGGGVQEDKEPAEEFAFTEQDVEKFRELVMGDTGSQAVRTPHLVVEGSNEGDLPVLDLSEVARFDAVRSVTSGEEGIYRVTNDFLNMRTSPKVTAEQLERLERGDTFTVLKFHDAAWAQIKLANGREGYVSTRYIAKMTSEDKLPEENAAFEGQYFVNFGFLNVRKEPDAQSDKIGELPGQAIVKPLSMDKVWARVPFEGKEGYVAVQYLQPFLPKFLVRQETYALPVLHYRMDKDGMQDLLVKHIGKLQQSNVNILTFADFKDFLFKQEERDVRLDPNSVLLGISGMTASNYKDVSDILRASGVRATLFLQTRDIGIDGITEQGILTLLANGHDIQSGGHTGDDLRSYTNAQVSLELAQSRQILEQKTGKTVFAIAYPGGGVNERVEKMAAEAGYLLGVASTPSSSFNRAQLLRMPSYQITTGMTEDDVLNIARGDQL